MIQLSHGFSGLAAGMCGHMRTPNSIYVPDAEKISPHTAAKRRRTCYNRRTFSIIEDLIEREAKALNVVVPA